MSLIAGATSVAARTFGEGCDARLARRPASDNPYSCDAEKSQHAAWGEGRNDVNIWWGKWAPPGTVKPLRKVRLGRFA